MTSIAPENRDSEFTWKEYQTRINSELADILGNFVNRALVLTQKYYDGKVPERGNLTSEDESMIADIQSSVKRSEELIYTYKLRDAQAEAMNLARIGNKFLAETEPWKLIKTDEERVKTIMNLALQITANLSIVLQPFLPGTAEKLSEFLNFKSMKYSSAGDMNLLHAGHSTEKPTILFPKIEDELVENEILKLKQPMQSNFEPQKDEITFDDFSKLDIRLGKILTAEKVEKADKLLKMTIDTGIDQRTIVSGIAEYYAPENIIGKTVQVLINLAPRKIRGVESQGMILMAENENGELSFMSPEKDFGKGGDVR